MERELGHTATGIAEDEYPVLWDEDRPKELPLAELREWLIQHHTLNRKELAAKKDAEAREKLVPVRLVGKLSVTERRARRVLNKGRKEGLRPRRKRHGRTTSTHR